jgi:sugar lactone lactonase YvrE
MGPRRRLVAVAIVALVFAAASCGDDDDSDDAAPTSSSPVTTQAEPELATGTVEELIGFDIAARQNSEGLAVDESGDMYVSFSFLGKVVRVRDGETTTEDVGSVPGLGAQDFGPLGLAIDGDDVVVAVQSATSGGVWRIPKSGGEAARIPGTEEIGFANDVAVDDEGIIWVASSVEGKDESGANVGGVWRIADDTVEKWLVAPVIGGTGTSGLPAPIGANGIEVRDDTVYVSVTEQGQVVAIPIGSDAKPGTPSIYAKDANLGGADGITFDDAGNLYVASIGQSHIVRVDKDDQAVTVIAGNEDGLDYPSTVKFGAGQYEGDLLALNFAVGELLGATTVEGPGLLRIPAA